MYVLVIYHYKYITYVLLWFYVENKSVLYDIASASQNMGGRKLY